MSDEPPIRQNPETPVRIREARPRLVTLQDQQVLAETKLSAISNTLGRMAAAIAHSKQRNIHHSRMLSDKQEADAVQRRQRKPFEITILRPSGLHHVYQQAA